MSNRRDGDVETNDVQVEDYRPDEYLPRGSVSDDSDSVGLNEKGGSLFLCLFTDNAGAIEIPYPSIHGMTRDADPKDSRWIEIYFQADIDFMTDDGEALEGIHSYQARLTGRRLESVIRQVRIGHRATIYVNKAVPPDKPMVDGIVVSVRE